MGTSFRPRRIYLSALVLSLVASTLLVSTPAAANTPASEPFETSVSGGGDTETTARADLEARIKTVEYRWLVECTPTAEGVTVYELYEGSWAARADIDCMPTNAKCFPMNYTYQAKSTSGLLLYSVLFRQQVCRNRDGEVWWGRKPNHRVFEGPDAQVDATPPDCGANGTETDVDDRRTDYVESFCSYEVRATGSTTYSLSFEGPGVSFGPEFTLEPTPRNYSHRVEARPDGCFLISLNTGDSSPICI